MFSKNDILQADDAINEQALKIPALMADMKKAAESGLGSAQALNDNDLLALIRAEIQDKSDELGIRQTRLVLKSIDNAFLIVELALARLHLLLRDSRSVYSSKETKYLGADVNSHNRICVEFIQRAIAHKNSLGDVISPEETTRFKGKIKTLGIDSERIGLWIARFMPEKPDTTLAEDYFSYAEPLPINRREWFIDNTVELGKAYTEAVKNTMELTRTTIEQMTLIDTGIVPYGVGGLRRNFLTIKKDLMGSLPYFISYMQNDLSMAKGNFKAALHFIQN